MEEKRAEALQRLQELKTEHEASVDEGPGEAPGFTEDEALSRKSYQLVAEDALESGVLTQADLEAAGLPLALEETE